MRRSGGSLIVVVLLVLAGSFGPVLAGGDVQSRSRGSGPIVGTPPARRHAVTSAHSSPAALPARPLSGASGPASPSLSPSQAPSSPAFTSPALSPSQAPSSPAFTSPALSPSQASPVNAPASPPVLPLSGASDDPVKRAQAQGVALADQVDHGGVQALFTGLGQVAGDMVEMKVTNVSSAPVTMVFVPGIVMASPPDSGVQPIVVEEEFSLVLQPGETVQRRLVCYCLDRKLAPPPKGKSIAYVFSRNPATYARAIRVLWSGLSLDASGRYSPMLAPLQHRRVVIQRAIWTSQEEKPAPDDQARAGLRKEIKEDAARSGKHLATRQLERLADTIWKDVTQTLQYAR